MHVEIADFADGGVRSASGTADAVRNDGIDLVDMVRPWCLLAQASARIATADRPGLVTSLKLHTYGPSAVRD